MSVLHHTCNCLPRYYRAVRESVTQPLPEGLCRAVACERNRAVEGERRILHGCVELLLQTVATEVGAALDAASIDPTWRDNHRDLVRLASLQPVWGFSCMFHSDFAHICWHFLLSSPLICRYFTTNSYITKSISVIFRLLALVLHYFVVVLCHFTGFLTRNVNSPSLYSLYRRALYNCANPDHPSGTWFNPLSNCFDRDAVGTEQMGSGE